MNISFKHIQLIKSLTMRDLSARFRGSVLGFSWFIIAPLFLLSIYTFVFGVVFKSRWQPGGDEGSVYQYAAIMFLGQVIFSFFADCVNRSTVCITGSTAYIKKTNMPAEILPLVTFLSSLFQFFISLFIALIFISVAVEWSPAGIIMLPLVLFPLFFLSIGLSMIMASMGVFVRDSAMIVGVILQMLFFASPVVYPSSAVPLQYQWLISLNPIAGIIEIARLMIFNGSLGGSGEWAYISICSLTIFIIGFFWFRMTKVIFVDIL